MLQFFRIQSVTDTSVAMIILGAFAYIPATAIIYLLNERTRKEKRLQYICGVGTFLYWLTSLLWDMVIILMGTIVHNPNPFSAFWSNEKWEYNYNSIQMLNVHFIENLTYIKILYTILNFPDELHSYHCTGNSDSCSLWFAHLYIRRESASICRHFTVLWVRHHATNGSEICLWQQLRNTCIAYSKILLHIVKCFGWCTMRLNVLCFILL